MSTILTLLFPLAVVVMLTLPVIPAYRGIVTGKKARRSIVWNLCVFFGICGLMVILPVGNLVAYAAGETLNAAVAEFTTGKGLGYLGAALVTGMSCLGAGIAVASAAPAAIGATSEDPKSFGTSLIFVVLGEGVALYGMLVSILIINAL
jgi:V/A-type H+-transporting ATPase subunit K